LRPYPATEKASGEAWTRSLRSVAPRQVEAFPQPVFSKAVKATREYSAAQGAWQSFERPRTPVLKPVRG